jgi:tripartite-type tricarboxylate transporter receptor subunit TctC
MDRDPDAAPLRGRRRTLGLLLIPAFVASPLARSEAFPSRPIRLVVVAPPGSAPDVAARVIAEHMREALGQPVVVEAKPGAGGLLATLDVVRAPADGYTLLLCGVTQISIAPHANRKLPYDPVKDLQPVAATNETPLVLVSASAKDRASTLAEYVRWGAQQSPLFIATTGAGTMGHFDGVVFGKVAGIKPEFVHYKTAADAASGLFNGDVHGMFASPALVAQHLKSGRLRAYATTSATRLGTLPEVPTVRELGQPELEINAWFGIFAPGRTPAELLDRLSAAVVQAVRSAEGRARLLEQGFVPTGIGRAEFQAMLPGESQRWARIVAASGFKSDE